jgi:toxin ParE1/3/4
MPGSNGWVLRPAAEADLSGIWLEGASRWSVEQAEHYSDGLFALFDLLVEFPEIARERAEFSPPVRIHPSGAHLVIYRREGQGIEIVRILHGHQNLTAYLSDG